MNKQQFNIEVESRLLEVFRAFEQGQDVSPATLFRLEGFIEAGCYLGLSAEDEIKAMMQSLHQQVFSQPMLVPVGRGIEIPTMMKRAPVYPSTK